MSIRLRLTVLYSAILALTLIAFSVALYITVSRVTYGVLEDTLANEAKRLADPARMQLGHIEYPARKFAAPETYVQTRGPDGAIADRTANLGDASLPLADAGLRAFQFFQLYVDHLPPHPVPTLLPASRMLRRVPSDWSCSASERAT